MRLRTCDQEETGSEERKVDAGEKVVECSDLVRVYSTRGITGRRREFAALKDLNLAITRGSVFGLLGPNGAGKTTTVRILSTLLTPSSGSARVMGYDVRSQARQVRRNIGFILGGDRGLYGRITGEQNLRYFGALNHLSPRDCRQRSAQLLERVGLTEHARTPVENYSRGMKQRLHIARGLLMDPPVLFLDEPTIGLDPIGAQELRNYVPELAAEGKTILLTTHYMAEADMLCDTIAIINRGELAAMGTPDDIKRRFSRVGIVEVLVRNARGGLVEEVSAIQGVEHVESSAENAFQKLTLSVAAGFDVRDRAAEVIGPDNIESIVMRDPTLEEAYISILR